MHKRSLSLDVTQRLIAGSLALAGFGTLYTCSQYIGGHFDIGLIKEETVHVIGHLTVYGVLAIFLGKTLNNRWGWAWAVSVVLATGEELYQGLVPGRTASLDDAVLNILTITVYLLIWVWLESVVAGWHRRRSGQGVEAGSAPEAGLAYIPAAAGTKR